MQNIAHIIEMVVNDKANTMNKWRKVQAKQLVVAAARLPKNVYFGSHIEAAGYRKCMDVIFGQNTAFMSEVSPMGAVNSLTVLQEQALKTAPLVVTDGTVVTLAMPGYEMIGLPMRYFQAFCKPLENDIKVDAKYISDWELYTFNYDALMNNSETYGIVIPTHIKGVFTDNRNRRYVVNMASELYDSVLSDHGSGDIALVTFVMGKPDYNKIQIVHNAKFYKNYNLTVGGWAKSNIRFNTKLADVTLEKMRKSYPIKTLITLLNTANDVNTKAKDTVQQKEIVQPETNTGTVTFNVTTVDMCENWADISDNTKVADGEVVLSLFAATNNKQAKLTAKVVAATDNGTRTYGLVVVISNANDEILKSAASILTQQSALLAEKSAIQYVIESLVSRGLTIDTANMQIKHITVRTPEERAKCLFSFDEIENYIAYLREAELQYDTDNITPKGWEFIDEKAPVLTLERIKEDFADGAYDWQEGITKRNVESYWNDIINSADIELRMPDDADDVSWWNDDDDDTDDDIIE